MSQLAKEGTSLKELREKAAAMASLQKAGIDSDKAMRDAPKSSPPLNAPCPTRTV
jgi:hypothetical protein